MTPRSEIESGELISFVGVLRRNGYNVGTEQYISAQRLLVTLASQGDWLAQPRRLGSMLAPVLCSSREEQETFPRFYEQWLGTRPAIFQQTKRDAETVETPAAARIRTPQPEKSPARLRLKWWGWSALIVITIAIVLFVTFALNTRQPAPTARTIQGRVTDLDDHPIPGAGIRLSPDLSAKTDSEGNFSVTYLTTAQLLSLSIELPPGIFRAVLIISAPVELRSNTLVSGFYNVNLQPRTTRNQPSWWRKFPIRVATILVGITLLCVAAVWLLRYTRRLGLRKWRTKKQVRLDKLIVKDTSEQLTRALSLRRTAQEMRRYRNFDARDLDVPGTIAGTLREGLFTPAYTSRRSLPEYLVLIERASFGDQQARLVAEMTERLIKNDVFIERYFFQDDPRIVRKDDPKAQFRTLQDLAACYPEHYLMIFSRGAGFFNPLTGLPHRWLGTLSAWPTRFLLTTDFRHGDARESALSELGFRVLPDSKEGLAALIESLDGTPPRRAQGTSRVKPLPPLLRERPGRWLKSYPPAPPVLDELCRQLKEFLGDEDYYWLCACTVYPLLYLDLTLYLGLHLDGLKLGGQENLYERFSKLVRLPWFRSGSIPDWLRARLIFSLSEEQEKAVRRSLEWLLLSSLSRPEGFALPLVRERQPDEHRFFSRAWGKLLSRVREVQRRFLVEDILHSEPDDSRLSDYVLITFMSGRKLNKLSLRLPEELRSVLYPHEQSLADSYLLWSMMILSVATWVALLFIGWATSEFLAFSLCALLGTCWMALNVQSLRQLMRSGGKAVIAPDEEPAPAESATESAPPPIHDPKAPAITREQIITAAVAMSLAALAVASQRWLATSLAFTGANSDDLQTFSSVVQLLFWFLAAAALLGGLWRVPGGATDQGATVWFIQTAIDFLRDSLRKRVELPATLQPVQASTITYAKEVNHQQTANALHQLPSPPRDFTGRAEELEELMREIERGGATISGLQGQGGVGKTALALKLAEQLAPRYPDAQFYLDLKGTTQPLTPSDAMAHVIRAYDVTAKLPDKEDELRALYNYVLYNQRALLLMDNARDAAQVEPLIPPDTCALLVTSRNHFTLPGLFAKNLDTLPPENARALLTRIAPRIGERADEIARLCGYLPLALRLAASALSERRDLSPADYARRLSDEQQRLKLLDKVEVSLSLSYDLLAPDLQKLWRSLAVFPATFDAPAAAAVWEAEQDAAQDALGELVKYSLLDWDDATARYSLHDLARLLADKHLSDEERYAAQARHAEHYLNVLREAQGLYLQGGEAIMRGLGLFDTEVPNIQIGQRWAARRSRGDDAAAKRCSEYASVGEHLLDLRLHPRERILWLEAALGAAHQLNDRSAEASHLGNQGIAYMNLGEFRRAVSSHRQQLSIAREIRSREDEEYALGNLGMAYSYLGDLRRSIEFYEQALEIARELADRRGEGAVLGNLGVAHAALNDPGRAASFFEQQLDITRKIGDRRGEGEAVGNLGVAHMNLGETRRAVAFLEQSLHLARELGDRRGEMSALGNLGLAYAKLEETRRAIDLYERALAIGREIDDVRAQGKVLLDLSSALYALGNSADAVAWAQQALAIFEQIKAPQAEEARRKLAQWRLEPASDEGMNK